MPHTLKRTGAVRATVLTALLGLAMLALVASSAQAKVVKVTGDQATVAPSTQLTKFLSDNGVSVGAIAPATLDGSGNLTAPIVGGRVNTKNLHGAIAMSGGLKLTKGERSLKLRRFVAVNRAKGAVLSAKVDGKRLIVARLTDRSAEVSGTSGTVEADLRLSKGAARRINYVAGKHLVSAGALLGHVSAAVTTG
jgi:hypothetical protein